MRQSAETVCRACLGVAVAVYIVVFCRLTFGLYDRYQMMAFDLGIFDQAAWLISQGQTPFVTVRGIHLLGDHFSVFSTSWPRCTGSGTAPRPSCWRRPPRWL